MATGTVIRGLGGASGLGETALERSDERALAIDAGAVFSGGLNYFGTAYTGAQINVGTNGIVSFGAALTAYPQIGVDLPFVDFIAPFWADVDTRIDEEGAESGQIWIDLDAVGGHLTITWEDVGSYRYQAGQTNLFQLRLSDRGGGDFDIRLSYERIDWVSGSAADDAGAWAGFAARRLPYAVPLGGDMATLDSRAGNLGPPGLWLFEMRGGTIAGQSLANGDILAGGAGADILTGGALGDLLRGYDGSDILRGHGGTDWLFGGDGADTLNAGSGDDIVVAGGTHADLRDVIYGGAGHDNLDGGYGNDLIYGGTGNDTMEGGFGVDDLIGQSGDDVLSGAAWSDVIHGGPGADFLNGGFGYDRLNGGTGADRFFHLGVPDHGSDWVQDYRAAEGDVLVWGNPVHTGADFRVNFGMTAGAGNPAVAEAFVIHRGTGQIIWALVDGAAQPDITLMISGASYDLI